jgi:hypothetical protein
MMNLLALLIPNFSLGNLINQKPLIGDNLRYNLNFSPVVFNRNSIALLNKPCSDVVMINLGPSYMEKKGTTYSFIY